MSLPKKSGPPMNSFAYRQLEKFGWSEGKGLGKKENGIPQAIRPKLKFDTNGLGLDVGREFKNSWWEKMYNDAANKVNAVESDVDPAKDGKPAKGKYAAFVQASGVSEEAAQESSCGGTSSREYISSITDEELFKICGGRTAHKAARHGNKLSGKLKRIQEAEERILKNDLCKKIKIQEAEEKYVSGNKVKLKKEKNKKLNT